jgi:hypothetical protein
MLPVDFWEEGYPPLPRAQPDVVHDVRGTQGRDQIEAFDLSYGFTRNGRWWTCSRQSPGLASAHGLAERRARFPPRVPLDALLRKPRLANCQPRARSARRSCYGRAGERIHARHPLPSGRHPDAVQRARIADASPQSIYYQPRSRGWHVDWSRAGDAKAVERRALVKRLCRLRHDNPALRRAARVARGHSGRQGLCLLAPAAWGQETHAGGECVRRGRSRRRWTARGPCWARALSLLK